MGFIQGLHGTVALVLLCSLLFAEEAGVPLPTPGELTLIAAGLLIFTGGLDPWLFLPLAVASCLAGSATGYGWARLVGEHGLRSLAERLHQTPRLELASARLRQAGAREIALSRLIPGMRVYPTSRRVAAPDQPGAGQGRQRSQRDACHHASREAAAERRHGGGGDVADLRQGGELGQEPSLLRVVAAQAAVEAEAEQELADAE
jgi:hypothetical protein